LDAVLNTDLTSNTNLISSLRTLNTSLEANATQSANFKLEIIRNVENHVVLLEQTREALKQTEQKITEQITKVATIVQAKLGRREKSKQPDFVTDFLFVVAMVLFMVALASRSAMLL